MVCANTATDSFFMGVTQQGIEGEKLLFDLLHSRNIDFFQADAIGLDKDNYCIYEVKHQERYSPPPFEGHGLPPYQVSARLSFYKKTGIRCKFIVFEIPSNKVFEQWLDVLNNGPFHDTIGAKIRRIYPIESFEEVRPQVEW